MLAAMLLMLAPSADATPRPNIVVIMADDLGFSDLGCTGGEIPTPRLDALAASGTRMSRMYNTARCWPSRSALLAGYYAQQIRRDAVPGVNPSGGQGKRPAWAPLLPALLKPAGYRSYHSGKWHVDGPRLAGGFDRSYSMEDHDRFFYPRNHFEDDAKLPPVDPAKPVYVTETITDHALKCLADHAANHAGKPFFSYVAYTAPHFPLMAPAAVVEKHRQRYRQGWEKVRQSRWDKQGTFGVFSSKLSPVEREQGPPYPFPKAIEALGPGEVNRPLEWDSLTDAQRAFQADKMAVHAAMVEVMDTQVGRLVDAITTMGKLEDTLIVFLSDNGASAEIMVRGDGHDRTAPPGSAGSYLCLGPGWSTVANTPFRKHKTWVHEGGIATACIVRWPKGISGKGGWNGTPAHVVDLVPTVLAAAGVTPPAMAGQPPRPGVNLLPALRGEKPEARATALWWLHEGNAAVSDGNLKLVRAKGQPWELYDLAADRAETTDLAKSRSADAERLAALWESQWARFQADAKRGK